MLREKKCADAYAYLQSCSFEEAAPSSSSLWALGEAAAEEREEYIEFVRAALTASWASSDAELSYKVFMRFLDDMDTGGSRRSADTMHEADEDEDAAIRELAGLALKTLKRRREAGMVRILDYTLELCVCVQACCTFTPIPTPLCCCC